MVSKGQLQLAKRVPHRVVYGLGLSMVVGDGLQSDGAPQLDGLRGAVGCVLTGVAYWFLKSKQRAKVSGTAPRPSTCGLRRILCQLSSVGLIK